MNRNLPVTSRLNPTSPQTGSVLQGGIGGPSTNVYYRH
jgi:hypothetical protein